MSTPSTTSIATLLRDEIKPSVEELLKEHPKQTEKLRQLLFQVDDDIEKKKERLLRLHAKALEAVVAELANRLSRTGRLLERLEELEPDQNLVKELAAIEKLTSALGELERKMTKNYGIAKEYVDKVNDALEADEADTDVSEALREWAVVEAWLKKQLELFKKRHDQICTLRDTARKAVTNRDGKALADAQKASTAIADAQPTLQELQEGYKTYCKQCEVPGLSKPQLEQLARDRKTFDKIMDEITALAGKIVAADVVIQAMELAAVDVKKAAALLKLPGALLGKLEKALALDGSALEKALDALAKEGKLAGKGRDLIATLKKAKIV